MDVCKSMQTKPLGNMRYVLILVDNYSKYAVQFMKQKSDVTEKIQNYIRNIKNKFNKIPKVIKLDRGKEYVNTKLKNFLRIEGIETQYTVGYAAEQNGTKKNRYLIEMARCMLFDALPLLWREILPSLSLQLG